MNRRDSRPTPVPGSPPRSTVAAGLVVVMAGAWLMIAAHLWNQGFAAGFSRAWNDLAVGAAVAAVAGLQLLFVRVRASGLGLVNIPLGLWLITAPFVLGYEGLAAAPATWNNFIVGAVVAVLTAFTMPEDGTRVEVR